MSDPFRLDERVVLVTGGAMGIGLGAAAECAAAGARVVIADRDGPAARAAVTTLPPGSAVSVECDVGTIEGARLMVECALDTFGALDAALANAGINRGGPLLELAEEAWDEVLRVNLKAVFLCFQAAARAMVPRGAGSLVAISSIGAQRGTAGQANYSASKAGVIGLVRAAARELAPHRIRVNAIAPGPVRTPMSDIAFRDEQLRARSTAEVLLGRLGEPVDVGRTVRFLLSDAADWITGQVLPVNGGAYI